MGEDAVDSKQMLQDFASIRVIQQASAEQLDNLKQELKLKEEELAYAKSNLAEMRQEGRAKVRMIGNIGDLVGEIPEYKKKISELSESVDQTQRATQDKVEEILRVQQKQNRDNAMVEERIEGERVKERAREQTNIEELEKLLRGAQEIEVENAQRQMEREKQKVQEQTRILEEEIRLMREKHSKKIQTMKNQLLAANKASDQSKVMSMEDVRKDMDNMKQEYDRRVGDLAKQIAAFKERKAGKEAASKRKKVSFDLPDLPKVVSPSISENQDDERKPFGLAGDLKSSGGACESASNDSRSPSWSGMASWRLGRERTPTATTCEDISGKGEDLSIAGGVTTHQRDSFKFPAARSEELSSRGGDHPSKAGTVAAPHQNTPFKFIARPAGSSVHGLTPDFCTFAFQPMARGAVLSEASDMETETEEDFGSEISEQQVEATCRRENHTDVTTLHQDSALGEIRLQAKLSKSHSQIFCNLSPMTDECLDEGGDVIRSKKEGTRRTEESRGGARRPPKRKLYSESGDGPKILE